MGARRAPPDPERQQEALATHARERAGAARTGARRREEFSLLGEC